MTLQELRENLGTLNAQARAVIEAADRAAGGAGKGKLSAEESARVDAIYAEYDQVKAHADAAENAERQRARLTEHEAYMGASAGRSVAAGVSAPASPDNRAGDPIAFEVRPGQRVTFRLGSAEHARAMPDYQGRFNDYLLGGVSAGLQTSSDPKGGYLAPTQMAMELIKFLDDQVFMRQLAYVLPPLTSAVSLGIPSYDTDLADADWTAEVPASDMTEDDTAAFGKREMTPHLMTKLVKLSMKLLRVGVMNPDAFIASRIGYKAAITEEKQFLTGSGQQRPLGVFTASNDGITTARDTTCASQTAFTADELIDCLYALKTGYIARSTWIMHREAAKRARKLKDGQGQYLWQPSLQSGQPETLLGRPIVMSEYAPSTFTTGLYVAIVGDFKTGYWIVDSLQLEIQRLNELFSLRNQVGILGRKETDGMPVLAEAFSRLKLG